jgi:hypothetical protein
MLEGSFKLIQKVGKIEEEELLIFYVPHGFLRKRMGR